jgi:uncharacterized protein YjcR
MAFDAATRALIKIDYEDGDLTVEKIGEKYGCSASLVSKMAREGGWLMRSERRGFRPRAGSVTSRTAREAIAQRLARFINRKLDYLEIGMQNGTVTPDEAERGTKQVAAMIGGFGKVVGRPERPDEDKRKSASHADSVDDVERLQREIIERFARLERRREAARGSERA